MYACMYVHIGTRTHTHTHTQIYIYIYIYIYVNDRVCIVVATGTLVLLPVEAGLRIRAELDMEGHVIFDDEDSWWLVAQGLGVVSDQGSGCPSLQKRGCVSGSRLGWKILGLFLSQHQIKSS